MNYLGPYKQYHLDQDNERIGLFTALAEKFKIQSALYLGSFVHITPSFIFPKVVYVDSYKKAENFFKNPNVLRYVQEKKQYTEQAQVVFHKADYNRGFGEQERSFDLLISQYAGFVSRAGKKYLKLGGILVVNNSHGDASMAMLDPDYEFIGVYNRRSDTKYLISTENLDAYFIPQKSGIVTTKEHLEKTQRGIGYTKTPNGYLFRRIDL